VRLPVYISDPSKADGLVEGEALRHGYLTVRNVRQQNVLEGASQFVAANLADEPAVR